MSATRFDFVGIGNAIVDVVSRAADEELARSGLPKGRMTLIDAAQAVSIYDAMEPGIESSGGSVGNSCALGSVLGARVAFLGKVADDQLGAVFRHDLEAAGVYFPTAPLTGTAPTARCLVMVTPDAERTMGTCLGASVAFCRDDVDEALIADSAVTYLEGYLFDPPLAQEAFRHAALTAKQAGRQVAVSLSDPFCVARHRAAFRTLVRTHADILLANEAEICSLYETADLPAAAQAARAEVGIVAVTRGAAGSLVMTGDVVAEVPAGAAAVVDTTGAGDAYAAGFLAALTRGQDVRTAAALGSRAASRVIEDFGARPIRALAELRGVLSKAFE